MKTLFEEPDVSIVYLNMQDIITTSCDAKDPICPTNCDVKCIKEE